MKTVDISVFPTLQVIRRLNPKPGWGRGEESKGAQYITPDFIVSNDGGVLNLALNSRNNPKLLISSEYSGMQQELSSKSKLSSEEQNTLQFIRNKNDEAQWLIETLKQREQTMSATMSAIMRWQAPYFRSGDSTDLVPMRLKDIAEETGYDESTVSRVVNNKYVQTDFGTLPLKELFAKAAVTVMGSESLPGEQGDKMTTNHIKEALRKAIDEEDKRSPLTDEALCKVLQQRGFKLSRRTISKYRESMGIPVGRMRKELVQHT